MKDPAWVVKSVQPRENYTLLLTFADNSKRIYDARPLLEKPIFNQLKNPVLFMCAKAEYGTVIWNESIDIAPEHLYENSTPVVR